jgi:hypothetical protein
VVVVVGPPLQHFLGDGADAQHFALEIDSILRACQGGQVAVDCDGVEVYEQEWTGKQIVEELFQTISKPITIPVQEGFRAAANDPSRDGKTEGRRSWVSA